MTTMTKDAPAVAGASSPAISGTLLALAAITALALVLRVVWLGDQVIWHDERGQMEAALLPLGEMLERIRSHAAAAPLDYFGTRLMVTAFGESYAIRLWPALVGTATIPLLYLAGRRWFDERTGLIAALLLALAPFHVYYSGEARFYALSALMAVLALLAFRTRWFALVVALTLFTHYFTVLVPLALVVLHREQVRASAIGAVAWLPWAVYALSEQMGRKHPLGDLPQFPEPTYLVKLLVGDWNESGLPGIVIVATFALAAVLLALGARRGWWLLVIVAGSVLLTGIATLVGHYFWSPRQVLFTVPLLMLVMALGSRGRWPLIAAWCFLMLPFIDGMTGADAWNVRSPTLD